VAIRTDFHHCYQVISQLGKGSFARVFKSRRYTDNKEFAVKAFSKSHIIKKSSVASLKREIEILKELHHPFFLALEEVHETENSVYLVLELINGDSVLKKNIKAKQPSKEKDQVYILRSLLSALQILA
jgi:calcium-dependent protein kinase